MSRAFVKEDAPGPDEDPPERPVSASPNYVTPRGLGLLRAEEERLLAALAAFAGSQTEPARKRRKRELERDLRYVRARLESAIPVDPASQPKDQVRFGARVTLRSEAGAERRLRIVGEDEAEEGGELLPWPAPLASALLGLKAGEGLEWRLGGEEAERWTVLGVDYAG